ncbi:MAG TPA: amidohydrolase, partial [Ignisphaera sp.]|nr:amidohydrolase [Ignisphaera sp.]
MSLILRNCKFVITPTIDKSIKILENVDIVIENGIIQCISDKCEKPRGFEIIDCSKHAVIPAFGNAHTHVAMVALRGYADDYELFDWLKKVWLAER